MTDKRIGPDHLLEIAAATVREELAAALPADKRYAAAMVANAIDIVRRMLPGEAEGAEWTLLDRFYDEGEGTMRQLADDIRAGSLPDDKAKVLPGALRTCLIEELRAKNPRFLKSRGIGG